MATHSSVLAWKIPGMGKPGGLLSMGLHRVGHNWSDLAVSSDILIPIPSPFFFFFGSIFFRLKSSVFLCCKLFPLYLFFQFCFEGTSSAFFFFSLLLTPLSVWSSKVHPSGYQWHNNLISVAVVHVWVIALCVRVQSINHFLDLSYWKEQYSEGWGDVSFSIMVFVT